MFLQINIFKHTVLIYNNRVSVGTSKASAVFASLSVVYVSSCRTVMLPIQCLPRKDLTCSCCFRHTDASVSKILTTQLDKASIVFPKYQCFLKEISFWLLFCFAFTITLYLHHTSLCKSQSDLQVLTDSRLQGSWWETQYFGANVRNRDPERSSAARNQENSGNGKAGACTTYSLASACTGSSHTEGHSTTQSPQHQPPC